MAGTTDYPGALDVFDTTLPASQATADDEGRTHKGNHEDLAAAMNAIETELGANPSGSSATVAARIAAIEADIAVLDGVALHSGLYLPGTSGNYVSAPDAAGLDITGDQTLIFDGAAADWTPAAVMDLIGKWSGGLSILLRLTTTGTLRLVWTPDGVTTNFKDSTVAVGATDGTRKAVAVTIDVDNGAGGHDVRLFTAPTKAGPWTQLGATVTGAGTTSVFSGAGAVRIGDSSGSMFTGTVYGAEIRSGIGSAGVPGGTTVADPDFRLPWNDRHRDTVGNTWTLNGSAWAWKIGAAA